MPYKLYGFYLIEGFAIKKNEFEKQFENIIRKTNLSIKMITFIFNQASFSNLAISILSYTRVTSRYSWSSIYGPLGYKEVPYLSQFSE